VITKLKKVPRVVEALQQKNTVTGYGVDASDIFDDFDAPQKKVNVEETKVV